MDETIEVELVTDIIVEDDLNVTSDNNNDIEIIEEDSEFEVSVQKREYVITGDNMYIPLSYDESPQWLKDTINNITNFSLNQKLTEVDNLLSTLNNLIVELDIAKNTYTQSIISSADIDSRINAAITTLNSSMSNNDANIVNLIATKATPEEASAISLDVLSTSINNGQISSLVSNLQNAISTTNSSLSNNINTVHSEMIGEFEANATVIDSIQTYVGIDNAGASTSTGISAYIEGSDGIIGGADSKVVNNVYVDSLGNSKSKFEYNSIVNVGGIAYNSGFGLSNSSGTGIGSEFWINADKFKFTNSNATGSVTPFTIDASGVTPQIEFNGKVSFSNVTNVPQLGSTPQEVVTAINNAQTTTIDGPRITTGSITAAQINVTDLFSKNITYTGVITGGNVAGGGLIKSYNGKMTIDLVNGSIYIA